MHALLGKAAVQQLAGLAALESAVVPRVRLNGGQGLLTVGGFGAGGQGVRLRKLAVAARGSRGGGGREAAARWRCSPQQQGRRFLGL